MVGIVVSNTVLLIDFAQHLRGRRRIVSPTEAIRQGGVDPRAAGGDDGPGGLLRPASRWRWRWPRQRGQRPAGPGRHRRPVWPGLVTTLFVVPALYSLVVRDDTGGTEVAQA